MLDTKVIQEQFDVIEVKKTIFLDMGGSFFLYYIQVAPEQYLHCDGEVRTTPQNELNEVSGYFTTKKSAEEILSAFKHHKKFKSFLAPVDENLLEDKEKE